MWVSCHALRHTSASISSSSSHFHPHHHLFHKFCKVLGWEDPVLPWSDQSIRNCRGGRAQTYFRGCSGELEKDFGSGSTTRGWGSWMEQTGGQVACSGSGRWLAGTFYQFATSHNLLLEARGSADLMAVPPLYSWTCFWTISKWQWMHIWVWNG